MGMAGIGWRLDRLIRRGVTGAAAAYATGAAVMALPWVLTTAVLASLAAVIARVPELGGAQSTVNVAYAVALIVVGPIQVVVSRYVADRIYERRLGAIVAPLCRGLAVTLMACAAAAAAALLALHTAPRVACWGAVLAAVVGAQWTALSVGNGLCSPMLVLGAVGAGSVLSFVAAALLSTAIRLGVSGYLFGLIAGQTLTLVIVLVATLRTLPEETDDTPLLPAFGEYLALAGAGLAFNASLWADKWVAWWLLDSEVAARHSAASTMAWFSTIPCLAWVFVEVETAFHRRFRGFYRSLEGGATLAELRLRVRALEEEAVRLLRGAASLQLGVTVFLEIAAGQLARQWNIPADAVLPYRLLLVAAGSQALGLLGLVLLYYFDLRSEACVATGSLLLAVAALTGAAAMVGLPPSAGTAAGCTIGALVIWSRVLHGVRGVLQRTLLDQPLRV
jgi:uncharacterized membrane protein